MSAPIPAQIVRKLLCRYRAYDTGLAIRAYPVAAELAESHILAEYLAP